MIAVAVLSIALIGIIAQEVFEILKERQEALRALRRRRGECERCGHATRDCVCAFIFPPF